MQRALPLSLFICLTQCDNPVSPPKASKPADSKQSYIGDEPTYVRYRPHGAAFDYFMSGDNVTIHGTYGDDWYCVKGKTKYRGIEYTGWVLASKVVKKKEPLGDMPCKHPDKDGWSHTEYKICKIVKETPVRYGPVSGASMIPDPDYPGGKISPEQDFRLGWPTTDGNNGYKVPVGDYLWVAVITNSKNFYNSKPKTSPGRSGWIHKSAILCPMAKPAYFQDDPPPPPDPDDPPSMPSDTGEPPSDTGDPPPDSGDPQPEPVGPCQECEQTNCAGTKANCDNSPDCTSVVDCVQLCPEACLSCWPTCTSQNPNGAAVFNEHMTCMQQYCYTSCNQDDPCYDETIACKMNAECEAIFACINGTPNCDLACFAACADAHPNGKEQFTQLTQCQNSGCP